ncbi:hypothetical protein PbDSM24746_53240 [Paenibacillus macerans]|nr:hypothetical protein PbDSM24746_53240 [Paenibacillus macerans]GBK71700.1 hypothetical protein PbJCM17693_54080 [Paenibacillus macerans]GIP13063.1 hypothetical protein J1TS5_52330 [Paenibacillus macerans]
MGWKPYPFPPVHPRYGFAGAKDLASGDVFLIISIILLIIQAGNSGPDIV